MSTNDKTLNELFNKTKALVKVYYAMVDVGFEQEIIKLAKDQLATNEKLANLAEVVVSWEDIHNQKYLLIQIAKESGYPELENNLVEIIQSEITLGINLHTKEPEGTLRVEFNYTGDDGFEYESEVFIKSITNLEF